MKKIEDIICNIKEELHGAKDYAEKYNEYKTSQPVWAKYYSEMASQELVHAEYLHTIGQGIIDSLNWVPADDMEAWNKCKAKFAEKTAVVRLMLSK